MVFGVDLLLPKPAAEPLLSPLSGWSDLNRRPPAPKAGALPSCATARLNSHKLQRKTQNVRIPASVRIG